MLVGNRIGHARHFLRGVVFQDRESMPSLHALPSRAGNRSPLGLIRILPWFAMRWLAALENPPDELRRRF